MTGWQSWLWVVAIGLGGVVSQARAASYEIVDLGTVPGFAEYTYPAAINNSGHIVGSANSGPPGSPQHAFLYSNGTIQDLQTLGGTNSGALGINASGQVIGYSDSIGHTEAFLYDGPLRDPRTSSCTTAA